MTTVTIEKRYGSATVRSRVTAPSIKEAVEKLGTDAKVVFPIDGEAFFERRDPAPVPVPEYAGLRQLDAVAS